MHQTNATAKLTLLADLPPYIYGTTRLGDNQIPFDDRVRMARIAMGAGIWFHTSHTYGNALEVLRAAFDQARAKVPKLIVKIIGSTVDELRDCHPPEHRAAGSGQHRTRPTLPGR